MTFLTAAALYGCACLTLLAAWMILGHRRAQRRAQQQDASAAAVQPAPTHPRITTIDVATPQDVREILQDPDVPPMVKGIVAQAAHDAGLCDCDTFDQDGQLTDTDVAWLESQRGER